MAVDFKDYVDMCRKEAHFYSRKHRVDYSEMESQAFLIYTECVKKYVPGRAMFSTYLHTCLNGYLDCFALTYKRQQGTQLEKMEDSELDPSQLIESRSYNQSVFDLLDDARVALSKSAFLLLEWLVCREWEEAYKRKPTKTMARVHFNWTEKFLNTVWTECETYWGACAIY